MGQFFADSFQRRTGRPLAIVAGDPATASLVALTAPSRPSLYLESAPEYLPRVTQARTSRRRARWWSGRRPTPPAGRRPRSRGSFPIWCRGAARLRAALPGPHAAAAGRLGHDPSARAGAGRAAGAAAAARAAADAARRIARRRRRPGRSRSRRLSRRPAGPAAAPGAARAAAPAAAPAPSRARSSPELHAPQ